MATVMETAPVHELMSHHLSVEIVVPVFNEQDDLEWSVRRLRSYLDGSFPFNAVVTIADNASTDCTWRIAAALADQIPGVRAVHLDAKGRGRALRVTWLASEADVVAYMDVDLATDLRALMPLVAPLLSGHSDIAIGSRLAHGARVVRGPKRELISRCYNLLLRTTLHSRFSDAQCGFKAMRTDVARALVPLVVDNAWFFDTELLTLAEANGLRVHEVPVDWVDDPDSRVDIARTATDDLKGIWRLLRSRSAGAGPADLLRIAAWARPGAGSTRPGPSIVLFAIAYVGLFLALRPALGPLGANAAALAGCGLAGALVGNRIAAAGQPSRTALDGLARLAAQAGLTSALLTALIWARADSRPAEVILMLAGISVTALAGFILRQAHAFRGRVFAADRGGAADREPTRAMR
jgi:hypothetical protein